MDKYGTGLVTFVVLGVLMRLVLSREVEAAQDGNGFVLTYSGMWKACAKLSLGVPVFIAVVGSFDKNAGESIGLMVAVVGGLLLMVGGLYLEVMRRQVRVDASGIRMLSPWRAPRFMMWKSIVEVRWNAAASEIEFRTAKGTCIGVSYFLSGLGSLAEAMAEHLPHVDSAQTIAQKLKAQAPMGIS